VSNGSWESRGTPRKAFAIPGTGGLWESSKSTWGFVVLALLKPEPHRRPPNGTGDKKIAT